MNVLDILQGNLGSEVIDQFSNRLGTEKDKTQVAAQSAVSILLSAMNKNARSSKQAGGLFDALTQDHDGGLLDDVMAYAAGQAVSNSRAVNGAGILGHLLGKKQSGAVEMLTKVSGLDKDKTGPLLEMLAPIVMGAVGKNVKQQGLNKGGLTDLLDGVMRSGHQNQQEQSMIEKLLDADGDGSVLDDLLNIGMKFLRRR